MRKCSYKSAKWASSGYDLYAGCLLDTDLNGEYAERLDADILALAGETKIVCVVSRRTSRPYDYSYSTISRAIFALSAEELGNIPTDSSAPVEGSPLSNYTQLFDTALDDGTAVTQHTRTRILDKNQGKPSYYLGQTGTENVSMTITNSVRGYRPCFTLPDTLYVLDDGTVVEDTPPEISGEDSDLGTFSTSAPAVAYTVTDEDGDYVSVTIKLDGVVKKTHAVTLGASNTWQLTGIDWLKVLNGSHTITIIADDGYVQTERTYTFTKRVTSMSFTLAEPLPADAMITKAIESIIGVIPANATTKIEVCNNGYDASPTWQDVTQKVLAGEKFQITNTTKTAENWGYNVRVTVSRGDATGDIYINSMGGFFE